MNTDVAFYDFTRYCSYIQSKDRRHCVCKSEVDIFTGSILNNNNNNKKTCLNMYFPSLYCGFIISPAIRAVLTHYTGLS